MSTVVNCTAAVWPYLRVQSVMKLCVQSPFWQCMLPHILLMPQAKNFAELSASVAQLSRRVAHVTGSPGALSDTDKALAAAQVRCLELVRRFMG